MKSATLVARCQQLQVLQDAGLLLHVERGL
jgi:hypothetical protein